MTLLEENLCLLERCCRACKVRKDSLRFNRNVLQRLPLIGDLERLVPPLLLISLTEGFTATTSSFS